MKIILSGVPLFTKRLAKHLNSYDKNSTYMYINVKTTIWERLYFYYHMLTADVLLVNYVDTYYMKSVDFALKLNKKVVLLWTGTDVMHAIPRIKDGLFNKDYLYKTTHRSVATWLSEELKEVDIDAKYLTDFIYDDKNRNISVPTEFSVLIYIAQNREKFYGIETVIKLALNFPEIKFKIAGISEYEGIPNNIDLLGWVDFDKEIENCVVYIRYMEHDGEAHSVLESLCYGKVVFYNYDYPFVNYVSSYDELENGLYKVYKDYIDNKIEPNYEAIEYIKSKYNIEKVAQSYKELFKSL
jgi:hypothetical protein